jgi:hypothetical protein
MNTQIASAVFGIIFVAVAFLGFMPNPLVSAGGFFAVDFAHNLVHFVTGVVFVAAALHMPERTDLAFKAVGVGYVLITVAGFLTSGNMLFGMVHINEADRWLHLGLAVIILGAGYTLPNCRIARAI